MKTIHKYNLKSTDYQELVLPLGSKILSVNEQRENIVLYALVDTAITQIELFSIIIHGTGHLANDVEDYIFLGTVKMMNGSLMLHVFYK